MNNFSNMLVRFIKTNNFKFIINEKLGKRNLIYELDVDGSNLQMVLPIEIDLDIYVSESELEAINKSIIRRLLATDFSPMALIVIKYTKPVSNGNFIKEINIPIYQLQSYKDLVETFKFCFTRASGSYLDHIADKSFQ